MAKLLSATEIAALVAKSIAIAAAKNITGVAVDASVVTVTSAAHGFSNGDIVLQQAIGGAVEANSLFQISGVTTNTYVLDGLTMVTTYTSGGTAKKVTISKLAKDLKPAELEALLDAVNRRAYIAGTDAEYTAESALGTILA